jgi:hypothetical protein
MSINTGYVDHLLTTPEELHDRATAGIAELHRLREPFLAYEENQWYQEYTTKIAALEWALGKTRAEIDAKEAEHAALIPHDKYIHHPSFWWAWVLYWLIGRNDHLMIQSW